MFWTGYKRLPTVKRIFCGQRFGLFLGELPSILHCQVTTCGHQQTELGDPDNQQKFFLNQQDIIHSETDLSTIHIAGRQGRELAKFKLREHNDMKTIFIPLCFDTLREKNKVIPKFKQTPENDLQMYA